MALIRRIRKAHQDKKGEKRLSRAELRLEKDVQELTYRRSRLDNVHTRIEFNEDSKLKFTCTVLPAVGPYCHGSFVFEINIPEEYPFHPPAVRCITKIFHPNICPNTGNVALSILQEEWKPVFTINTVTLEIQKLFKSPNLNFTFNDKCANMVRNDFERFRIMAGSSVEESKVVEQRVQSGRKRTWSSERVGTQLNGKRSKTVSDPDKSSHDGSSYTGGGMKFPNRIGGSKRMFECTTSTESKSSFFDAESKVQQSRKKLKPNVAHARLISPKKAYPESISRNSLYELAVFPLKPYHVS